MTNTLLFSLTEAVLRCGVDCLALDNLMGGPPTASLITSPSSLNSHFLRPTCWIPKEFIFQQLHESLTVLEFYVKEENQEKMRLLPVLKCTTCCLTVLTDTGLCKLSASVSGCQWVQLFCMEEFNYMPLLHMHFMSDAILIDCPSAVTYHTTTKYTGILVRRFGLHCHTTNICLWHCRPA